MMPASDSIAPVGGITDVVGGFFASSDTCVFPITLRRRPSAAYRERKHTRKEIT